MLVRRNQPQDHETEADDGWLQWAVLMCSLPVLMFMTARAKLAEWLAGPAGRYRLVPIPVTPRRAGLRHHHSRR